MNAINNQDQACIGMSLVGFVTMSVASGAKRDLFTGLSAAIGSVAMLDSFYKSHKFKREDGNYNYANIALTAFMAISLTVFNVAYWMLPSGPRPSFCDANPTSCTNGTPIVGTATVSLGGG